MAVPFAIVGLGEALRDLFPDGPRFGGAPANFACHVAMLGDNCSVVSQVGDDELGQSALAALQRHCAGMRHMARSRAHATGTTPGGPDSRSPSTSPGTTSAGRLSSIRRRADAVCFGTLAQRSETSRETIRRFLTSTGSRCLRILDVNLRRPFFDDRVVFDSLRLADALKLNDEELPVVAEMAGLAGSGRDLMWGLRERFGLRLVAVTRGAEGAMILGDEGIVECLGTPVVVEDTVGAGDAFTAAMALVGCGGAAWTRSVTAPAASRRSSARRPAGRPSCPTR